MSDSRPICPTIFCCLLSGHPGECPATDEPVSEEQKPYILFPESQRTEPWTLGEALPWVMFKTSYTGSCSRCAATFTFGPSDTQTEQRINRAKIPCPFCGTWHDGYLANQATFVLQIEAEEDPAYKPQECPTCNL